MRAARGRRALLVALATLGMAGCTVAANTPGVFRGSSYRISPPAAWDVVRDGRADLVLARPGGTGAMLVDSTCGGRDSGRALDVLMRHLLFGLKDRRVVEREELMLGGHPAERVLFDGESEVGPVRGEAYVVKRADCVYDLLYVAPRGSFEAGRADFRRFVDSLDGS
jgi:hypothetical protein